MWDPLDGDIDPAQLTQALAKGARTGAVGSSVSVRLWVLSGMATKWIVKTEKGEIRCE